MPEEKNFGDRVFEAVVEKNSCLVAGLDPVWERLPPFLQEQASSEEPAQVAGCFERFCAEIIEGVESAVVGVKPQIAFFERYGPAGLEAFNRVCQKAKETGLLVIADVKRADIGSTAEAYAEAYLGDTEIGKNVDAVTVNPYFGWDGVKPFIERARPRGKGIFLLVRTSNPSAAELQDLTLAEADTPVFERVAELVKEWAGEAKGSSGYSDIGAVIGATNPAQAQSVRKILSHHWLLMPGLGAQGASPLDLKGLFDQNGLGVVASASRTIIYAWKEALAEKQFASAAHQAAEKIRDEINAVRFGVGRKV